MEKRTVVSKIEPSADGFVCVRFGKLRLDDEGNLVSCLWHRTQFAPDTDCDDQMAAVNDHLERMGEAAVEAADIEQIRAALTEARTPEVMAAHADRVARKQADDEARNAAALGARAQAEEKFQTAVAVEVAKALASMKGAS